MDQIPVVHNYYSDLLVSLAHYFDQVLGSDTIHSYEFNLGNKSFQLNYKPQKGLPSCIINYNSSQMQEYHDWFLHRPDMGNHLLIPIVYDATKDLSLLIQEAQYEHSVSVTFNCNSVFEMLELKQKFAPYLPLNKYIEVFNYYTFLEIPRYFLNPLMFDINRDVIYNLYRKRDALSNELIEMASVKYDPLIRLDSLTTNGINTDEKTFSLNMELTIYNSIPLYFQIPREEIPNLKKKINSINIDRICIPLYENIPIIEIKFIRDNYLEEIYLPLLNIKDNSFQTEFNLNNYNYFLTGLIKAKHESYSGLIESDNYSYPVNIDIINNKYINVSGILTGKVLFPTFNKNIISGLFKGNFNTNNLSIRSHIAEDVEITLNDPTNNKSIEYDLNELLLYDIDNNFACRIFEYNIIPYGTLSISNKRYSDKRLNINFEKSLITTLGIYNNSSKQVEYLNTNININKYGNIKYLTQNKVNDNFIEYYSIDGCINQYNWNYSFVQTNEQERVNSNVIFLLLDGVFDNTPKYGSVYIENISHDYYLNYNDLEQTQSVHLSTGFSKFQDFTFKTDHILYSIAIPNILDFIKITNDYVYLNVIPYDDIKKFPDIEHYRWALFFKNQIYSSLNSNFKLKEYFDPPFYYALTLQIPTKYYMLNFTDKNNIFYFKLFTERVN